jgi:uncharacterized coiled-coil DUF342 family protein
MSKLNHDYIGLSELEELREKFTNVRKDRKEASTKFKKLENELKEMTELFMEKF